MDRVARGRGAWTLLALLLAGVLVVGFVPRADANEQTFVRRHEMLALTNQAREQRHLVRLKLNARLSHLAKTHSREMARRGYLFHSDTSTLVRALRSYHWSMGGENVGVGGDLEGLQSAFMHSKVHRQNILRRVYDHTAIGIVRAHGRLWVTVIFYG